MNVTEHFAADEFSCRDGEPYPLARLDVDDAELRTWGATRLLPLCQTLEIIREAAGGKPLHVNSGFRSPSYNRRLGSHDTSQHPAGRAADITHPSLTADQLHGIILQLYRAGKLPRLGGIGKYETFVHVDTRPRPEDNHLSMWNGTRISNIA